MKNQKGFIQIPILIAIIAGVLVLGGGGYFGIHQYRSYQAGKIEQKKQAELNQKTEEEQRQKLQGLLDSQGEELEKQKSELEALKNKKPETITQTITKEVPAQKTEDDLASIIDQWKNRVAEVTCEWQYSNGVVYKSVRGSAFITNTTLYGVTAVTNNHVVAGANADGIYSSATLCGVKVYGMGERIVYARVTKNPFHGDTIHDSAYILLDNAPISSDNGFFSNLPIINICTSASIGDKVVILGYPLIGAEGGITATDGIVAGIENNYYITSAKIDQGNSGGVAILLKDNCYLGIPSSAAVGAIESLGRILKGTLIFGN